MKRVHRLSTRRVNTCFYCNVRLMPHPKPGVVVPAQARTVDHIIPRCQGGLNVRANKVFACHRCNAAKSGQMPHRQLLDEIGFSERDDGWFYGCVKVAAPREVQP